MQNQSQPNPNSAAASIREKLKLEGASISPYALLLWALEDPRCKAYFGAHPWIIKRVLASCLEVYFDQELEEAVKFLEIQKDKRNSDKSASPKSNQPMNSEDI